MITQFSIIVIFIIGLVIIRSGEPGVARGATGIRVHWEGREHFRVAHRHDEGRGQDADDVIGVAVQHERCADRRGAPAEAPHPEPVRQDHDPGAAALFVVRQEDPSGSRLRVKHRKEGRRRLHPLDALGLPAMVRAGINMGLSGVPHWGSDISGYKCFPDDVSLSNGELRATVTGTAPG